MKNIKKANKTISIPNEGAKRPPPGSL
jgi:hypothetical protein